jgi:carboxymethylenebutenolidase
MPTTRSETITAPDGATFAGHLTVPDGVSDRGARPGVLLLQEIFGVNEFLIAKAAQLADLGYVVLCPDVFWRVEPGVSLPHTEDALPTAFGYMERFTAGPVTQAPGDLGAALDHLRTLPEVSGPGTGKVAVMGYCLGGRLSYELAVLKDPDACVSYYGTGIAERLDAASEIACPVLFQFGGNDPYIPNEQVDAIRVAFEGRDEVEVHVQHQAGHAFENHLAPMFHVPQAAAASWPITVGFLERVLGP